MSWGDTLQIIGAVCSAIIAIMTVLGSVFKWPARIVKKYYEEHTKDIIDAKVNEIKEMIQKLNDSEIVNEEATRASLRHSITYIYEKYKDEKVLPGNTKNDLCSLYAAYTKLNGNSFIHEIYEEMMKWDTK